MRSSWTCTHSYMTFKISRCYVIHTYEAQDSGMNIKEVTIYRLFIYPSSKITITSLMFIPEFRAGFHGTSIPEGKINS